MARQNISRGASANDGTGDSLRDAAAKINENFAELYEHLSGDSAALSSGITFTGTSILDANSNELINFTTTASAVNEITITNKATGVAPIISATGGDTNINLNITSKGTGSVVISKAAFSSSEITANGAASTSATYIICNKGSALAVSLADGTTVGEYKIFTNKGAGTATITPTNFAQGTTFSLAQYDGCTVIWDGTNWYLVGNQGEVTVA